MESGSVIVPQYLRDDDLPWLRLLIDEWDRFVGKRRCELRERLREPLARGAPGAKVKLACSVLARLYRTAKRAAVAPRTARALVFEMAAAAGDRPRDETLGAAARALDVRVDALEASLFADLPGERLLVAPETPVDPTQLALQANLALVQGYLARASSVRLELEGNARVVIRHVKLKGLIATILPRERAQDAAIELSGPYALFKRTLLYGRALAGLVPLLAWCRRFRLDAQVVDHGRARSLSLATGDPILPAGEPRAFDSKLEERFARDFAKLAPDWHLVREPEPVDAGGSLVFPDFALEHRHSGRRHLLEIVGFWTRDYLERKLDRLAKAGIADLILCIDEERAVGEDDLPAGARAVPFRRRIDAAAVLAVVSP